MEVDLLPSVSVDAVESNGRRNYLAPNGKYPSISTIASMLSEKGIKAWRERVGDFRADLVSELAAERGTAVHELLEDRILKNKEPDMTALSPKGQERVGDTYRQIWEWLEDNIETAMALEYPVWSDVFQAAGRIDFVGVHKQGHPCIVDFKTAAKPKKREYIFGYFMQAGGYAVCFEERTGIPIDKLYIVIGVDEEPMAQVYEENSFEWMRFFIECRSKYLVRGM